MKRWPLIAVAWLAGCEQEDPVAYLLQDTQAQVVLDNASPHRWTLHVETNADAMRDGLTWATVDLDVSVVTGPAEPWEDQWVDVGLTGDDLAADSVYFDGPGQHGVHVQERYQVECVAGEPCSWDYLLELSRRQRGESDVAVDWSASALVTIGHESDAPDGAALSFDAIEIED